MKHTRDHLSLGMFALVGILLALGLAACGSSVPDVEWELSVSGAVSEPLTISYSELAEMPQTELNDILMEKTVGEDTTGSWSGVALDKLLEDAGASADAADAPVGGIVAIAADGYAIEIAKAELEGAIVALKENGEWIAEVDPDHGPIRLVCPHTPANRWVFQLQAIEVADSVQTGGIPADAAFKVTGLVESEIGWAEDKLRSFDTIEAESTNKAGETKTYTGVPFNDLLGEAAPKAEATMLVLVADDGYSAEVALAEIQDCADCIVSFRDQGGFSTVLPGFPGSVQVKGVVEVQVK